MTALPGTPPSQASSPVPATKPGGTARRRGGSGLLWVGSVLVGGLVLTALVSFVWTPWEVINTDYRHRSVGPFQFGHVLGTDLRGRDILTWIMAGSQTALYAGVVAVGIAAVVGTPLGILAGMAPRRWTEFILRVTDLWLAFPALLMALIFATVYGSSLTTAMVAIGISSIPSFIRVVRSGTIVVMTTDYVQAAKVAGRKGIGIALHHVLPNVAGLVIVQASVSYAIAILAEAALSFLGLGAGPTTASWGRMLFDNKAALQTDNPWMLLWPGLAIALAVLGFNLLGDGLRDRLDPRLVGR